ncbi:hypothetical protein [Paracoccus alkenifer]|uniref:Uncharacterized protein n=1 Tax=Paracoccus alkenifer TaxID=65735 RepID=A0A1H6N9M6_9RHOB|nr:hypothetical protein [Paracoccus alkenifer]SEI08259.1 hypothetical protein SAMN04488075_2712 [Paracoccus alkenifer]
MLIQNTLNSLAESPGVAAPAAVVAVSGDYTRGLAPHSSPAAAALLAPLGEATRFDLAPEAARRSALLGLVDDTSIRWPANESSMDMIIRIAKLADRPWPTDKAIEATRHAEDTAERKTLAVA